MRKHLAMRALGPSVVISLLLQCAPAAALPGFVRSMKKAHPDKNVNCASCHNVSNGVLPSNTNVKPEGVDFHAKLLAAERIRNQSLKALPEVITQPDFIMFGDTRSDAGVHQKVVTQICALHPKAVFHTGDVVASGGNTNLWKEAVKIEDCLIASKAYYPTCGNHEGKYCLNNPLRTALGNNKKNYTVDVGAFTFIALDSEDQTQEQLDWLSALPRGKNYIPFFHHPPYPTMAGHGADQGVLNDFVPRFKELGVKLSFNGHNHGYDRAEVDGVTYVTTGGGGAPSYPCGPDLSYTKFCVSDFHFVKCAILGKQVSCEVRSLTGKVFDSFGATYP